MGNSAFEHDGRSAGGVGPVGRAAKRQHARYTWWLHSDEGAITAEFATVLPVVALIAVILLGLTRTVVVSMNCQDAAAAAARELVVARDEANPQATARAIAGDAAVVSVNRHDSTVQVQVTCPVLPDPLGVLPTTVTGSATGVWG